MWLCSYLIQDVDELKRTEDCSLQRMASIFFSVMCCTHKEGERERFMDTHTCLN
jgi:hypothetical protein